MTSPSRPIRGRYAITKKIADGGMAEIFLARQVGSEGFERPVVLKRIRPALSADPQFRKMLINEAHIAMGLIHGNVVSVLDLGRADGWYFLVMELVDGWDLATILGRARAANLLLPLGLALHITAQVCRGLAYAHGRKGQDGRPLGIVHCDVSPENVLVSEHGEVKVADFGIAQAMVNRESSRNDTIRGKVDFISPEQVAGAKVDAASDIFSLGATLYLVATGRRPYEADTPGESLLKAKAAAYAPPGR